MILGPIVFTEELYQTGSKPPMHDSKTIEVTLLDGLIGTIIKYDFNCLSFILKLAYSIMAHVAHTILSSLL